jgi:DNA-binding XRE family transcriptional regulator
MVNRIRELLEVRQLSPTQFADLIGVGRPVISHILSERNKPSLEVVQKVLDAFPDISLSWLMKGTGPMLTDGASAPAAASTPVQAASPAQVAPVEVAPPVAAPSPAPTLVTATGASPQPQSFMAFGPSPKTTARPAATAPPTARPLPPKFRPGAAKLTDVPPLPADAATLLPVEPAAAPVIAAPAAPAPAAFVAPSLATAQPVGPTGLDNYSYGSTRPLPDYQENQQEAPAPQPVQPALGQALAAPAVVSSAPPAAEPSMPNPAAALSFLGEPGKAIRRIVIFYRDGSFSDYVPEGQ